MYDSHLHFYHTGAVLEQLDLSRLVNPEQVSELNPESQHFRGDWLIGFGWNEKNWANEATPHRRYLDARFPDFPVAFSRADGHALWLNTFALNRARERLGPRLLDTPFHLRDNSGELSGVFVDDAKILIDSLIPGPTAEDIRRCLLRAQNILLEKGFTHAREMTCFPAEWDELCSLVRNQQLKVNLELHFVCDRIEDLESTLQLCQKALKQARELPSAQLKPLGPKIFLDGALGSQGAWISVPYAGGSGGWCGQALWNKEDLKLAMKRSAELGLEIAVHAIGDKSFDLILECDEELFSSEPAPPGYQVHVEHAQIVRQDSLDRFMKRPERIKRFSFHCQPSHYIHDRVWVRKLIPDLYPYSYPWSRLIQRGLKVYFGSDAPIEPIGLEHTEKGLLLAEQDGLGVMPKNWRDFHLPPLRD